ncbi:Clavaminate synthase-like protein [Venustampulla echinocandica]|uniref:Clavaminate synthase-like protein n=1 Tax=Venustampulla echinocandica TaxID=2656787 RepID=A0A370TCZ8_9HELO|nr:Clavaminate synthase-like protein [Venustampulla echinocandica]RDL32343.1 Clavaminate synthase-like protein [Venustampulla echinocandica]
MQIETLDFSKFHAGTDAERYEFSKALLAGFASTGFVKLINHGFSREEISRMFEENRRFFELTDSVKARIANEDGPKPQRGWSSLGAEKTGLLNTGGKTNLTKPDIESRQDAKEHFDIGPSEDTEFPNKWPDDKLIPGFQSWLESYFDRSQCITLALMEALEISMHLPKGAFVQKCQGHASELRLNHYPGIAVKILEEGRTSRIWPHTDFGIITLLSQDDVGGLEIQDKDHPANFVPVPREDLSELIVNIGDTLERWTNGFLQAGLHQVTAPREMLNRSNENLLPRRSIAFFLKAHRQMSVGPLPQFVAEKTPAKYEDITALAYQQRRTAIVY